VKPDLASHTLIHFLDRFAYRNPKAPHSGPRGSSIMQPLAGGEHQHILVTNRLAQRNVEPVNSESFWRRKAEDVAVDEVFFHKYFNQIGKGKRSRKGISSKDSKDLVTKADGSENEDEVWQALVESRPDVEGLSEDESDLDMLDLDDSDDSSSGIGNIEVESGDEAEGSVQLETVDMFRHNDEDPLSDMDELFRQELEYNNHVRVVPSEDKSSNKDKRKRLKSLPTFASMEEYAKMLEDDEGE
jgi:ribosome biogenesis protein MAK21